ncbi:class I SAM-dependent methyltransferase [Anaerotruncus colihominis]|uniref:class I SAM-dependent methyltransferase n=1 Tax=Anaerotruncus colihominis TaxID=169435 RepID=UPI003AB7432D
MLTVNSNTMQSIPEEYEFDWIAQNIFFPIYPVIVDDILARIPRRDGVLIDVGCGSGHLGLALLERTRYKGCLIDINQTALELGRAHAQERGLADRAVFMRQDVHAMDFPDGYADLIISRGSYHFWADLEKALTEIYRVLAPGGNTYIGGGMGSAALAESIRPQMQAVMPGWPDGPLQRSGKISTEYLKTFLERQSIPHEIVENQEQGRWIIMHK